MGDGDRLMDRLNDWVSQYPVCSYCRQRPAATVEQPKRRSRKGGTHKMMLFTVFTLAGIGLFITKRRGWGTFCFVIAFVDLFFML
jgi:hypothetical protein